MYIISQCWCKQSEGMHIGRYILRLILPKNCVNYYYQLSKLQVKCQISQINFLPSVVNSLIFFFFGRIPLKREPGVKLFLHSFVPCLCIKSKSAKIRPKNGTISGIDLWKTAGLALKNNIIIHQKQNSFHRKTNDLLRWLYNSEMVKS